MSSETSYYFKKDKVDDRKLHLYWRLRTDGEIFSEMHLAEVTINPINHYNFFAGLEFKTRGGEYKNTK